MYRVLLPPPEEEAPVPPILKDKFSNSWRVQVPGVKVTILLVEVDAKVVLLPFAVVLLYN